MYYQILKILAFFFRIGDNPPPLGSGVYVGFDPTADSLHIGNLLAILSLLHFRTCGCKAIAVVNRQFICPIDFALISALKASRTIFM